MEKPATPVGRSEPEPRESTVLGDGAAEIVRAAAKLLDQEMAVGITTAKAVQERLQRERRVEPADLREALQRFQDQAHGLISSLNHQMEGQRLQANMDLAKSFIDKANELVDVAVGFVTTGTELANQVLQANLAKTESTPKPPR